VGPKTAEAAAEAGIRTVGDLLFHIPRRHRDLRIRELGSLEPGETATVLVEVQGSQPRPFRKGRLRMVSVKVGDASGHVRATWFNQPWVASKLVPGTELLMTGKFSGKGFAVREWELASPGPRDPSEGEGGAAGEGVLDPPHPPPPAGESELMPVHAATEDLRPQKIREWVEQVVGWAPNAIEGLPASAMLSALCSYRGR
jgi:RecG-like helicase